jgi:hypothetical protein
MLITSQGDKYLKYILDLNLCCYKLPEDGTLVLKHVVVFTYNEVC